MLSDIDFVLYNKTRRCNFSVVVMLDAAKICVKFFKLAFSFILQCPIAADQKHGCGKFVVNYINLIIETKFMSQYNISAPKDSNCWYSTRLVYYIYIYMSHNAYLYLVPPQRTHRSEASHGQAPYSHRFCHCTLRCRSLVYQLEKNHWTGSSGSDHSPHNQGLWHSPANKSYLHVNIRTLTIVCIKCSSNYHTDPELLPALQNPPIPAGASSHIPQILLKNPAVCSGETAWIQEQINLPPPPTPP